VPPQNSGFRFDSLKSIVPALKNGCFSLINKTIARVMHGTSQFVADLQIRTDFLVAGKKRVLFGNPNYTNYSGINRKYISANGVYLAGLALEDFAKTSAEKRLIKEDTYRTLSGMDQADSHEAFLYNMLISWGKALIASSNQEVRPNVFQVKTHPYSDSHMNVALDQGHNVHAYDIDLGYPITEVELVHAAFMIRTKEDYWNRPFVLHYSALAPTQEAFYLMHTLGRTNTTALNFDIDIPSLDSDLLLLDPIGGGGVVTLNFEEIDWKDHDTMWMFITDYVKLNRLEEQFAAVLESFGTMFAHPMWSSIEACIYQNVTLQITLPAFSPTRARIHTALEGEPFVPEAGPVEFIVEQGRMPKQFLQFSAVANYYMWYGHYAMYHNAARGRRDWKNVFGSIDHDLDILRSPVARAASISAITGQEFTTFMNEGCNVTLNFEDLYDSGWKVTGEEKDHAIHSPVEISAIPAPVSGSLILGAVAGEYEVLRHLRGLQTVPVSQFRGQMVPNEHVLSLANVYRLFGHDTTFTRIDTMQEVKPWATAHECIVEPSSVPFEHEYDVPIALRDSEERPGRHYLLPSLGSLPGSDDLVITIRRPFIDLCEYGTRKTVTSSHRPTRLKPVVGKFQIKAGARIMEHLIASRRVPAPQRKPDFHRDLPVTTPNPPEGPRIVAPAPLDVDVPAVASTRDVVAAGSSAG